MLKGSVKSNSGSHRIKKNAYYTFLNGLHIGTNSGITIKKKVFDKCGLFRADLPAAEDTEFFLRVSKCFNYVNNSKILINIERDGSDRLSKKLDKVATAYNIFLKDHFDAIKRVKKLRIKYYYKMSWLNYHLGDNKKARKYFTLLIKDKLFHYKAWFVFLSYELFGLKVGQYLHLRFAK